MLKPLGLLAHGHSAAHSNGDDYRVAKLFAALFNISDDDVMRVLAFVIAETLEAGTAVVEALGIHLKVDIRDYWQTVRLSSIFSAKRRCQIKSKLGCEPNLAC